MCVQAIKNAQEVSLLLATNPSFRVTLTRKEANVSYRAMSNHSPHLFAVWIREQRRPFLILRPLGLVTVHLLHHYAGPHLRHVARLYSLRELRIYLRSKTQ